MTRIFFVLKWSHKFNLPACLGFVISQILFFISRRNKKFMHLKILKSTLFLHENNKMKNILLYFSQKML